MPEVETSTPLNWKANFDASEEEFEKPFKDIWEENGEKLPFVAMIVDTSLNRNGWAVPEDELDSIAAQVTDNQLRINHSKKEVRDVVGNFTEASRVGNSITAKGFIVDEAVARLVHSKSVNNISISSKKPDDILCSKCGISTRGKKLCDGGHNVLKGVELVEISIVPTGAYPNAKIFSASLDEYMANHEQDFMDAGCDRKKEAEKLAEDKKDEKKEDEEDEKDAEDEDEDMVKVVKALRAENKKLKEAAAKKAMDDDEKEKKDKDAALLAEKEALEAENKQIMERLKANVEPITGETVSASVEDEGKPKGTFDALMQEYEEFAASLNNVLYMDGE